ncbi:hypothetical protein [uncultured Piscinibacter sp.]|uniref:hypothetical protein n=1 Tax=uncultured Piscinibacter sp. TaxID=1131835 RepID=UPI00260FAE90|nr:hypothetical protein [uncultured Piscinibacter sp.]
MSLISDLAQAPENLPAPSRFTAFCGVLYAAAGLVFLAWPGVVQTVFRDPAFIGREESLVRVLGMVVAVVGWFYFFGGRTGGRQFVAATVVDRLVLVPAVLVPTAAAGVFPHVMLTFAVLDPTLALVAWYLLSRRPG